MDSEHWEAFTKTSFDFQKRILELQHRVIDGEMTVENFIDHLHAFDESIKKQDAIRQGNRDRYEARGMDPDEADR